VEKKVGNAGIGEVGTPLDDVLEIHGAVMGAKLLAKECLPCGAKLGSPDPLNELLTRAWHKPNFDGAICAYCGVAKFKLWPHLSMKDVRQKIKTEEASRDRFFSYIREMISHLKSGNITLRSCPTERVVKEDRVQGH